MLMNINIIDCRNRCLAFYLSRAQQDTRGETISIMLPEDHALIPNELKQALLLYVVPADPVQIMINIIVEVNQWVDREKAKRLCHNTEASILQFFNQLPMPAPKYQLNLYEQDQLVALAYQPLGELC